MINFVDHTYSIIIIIDVLTRNLVLEATHWDEKENINKRPKDRTNKHLDDLIQAITNCGVTFDVWEKTNADGKGSGISDFTSLMGSDKRLLMKTLHDNLRGVLHPDSEDTVVKIWKVTVNIETVKLLKYLLITVR